MSQTDTAPHGGFQPDLFEPKPAPSAKSLRRQESKRRRREQEANQAPKPLLPLNATQKEYIQALNSGFVTQIFAVGEAGTGKTYIPSRIAMKKLLAGDIERIYIARPTVSSPRHRLGFLPGDAKRKLAPWLVPITEAFKAEASIKQIDTLMQSGKIEFVAFEHLRGRTLSNAFVILDEAQNCTLMDLKLFLTRKGEDSVFIIAGDPTQIDIPDSGLDPILNMIEDQDLSPTIIEFDAEDVVRSADAKEWVKAFKKLHDSQAD